MKDRTIGIGRLGPDTHEGGSESGGTHARRSQTQKPKLQPVENFSSMSRSYPITPGPAAWTATCHADRRARALQRKAVGTALVVEDHEVATSGGSCSLS